MFEKDDPLTPLEQLLIVLPPSNACFLPSTYYDLVTDENSFLAEYFPRSFKIDVNKGLKNIYSEPILPSVDINLIRKVVANIPITEYEANRDNIHCKPFSKIFNIVRTA